MNNAICYCGGKMDIYKTFESGGMDGSYANWTLRCSKCGIIKEYAADGFYGRKYFSAIEDVINEWNRNKYSLFTRQDHTEEVAKAFQLGFSFGFIDGLKESEEKE